MADAVDEELDLVGVVVVAPEVDLLARHPVPMREEVEYRPFRPFALVHVVDVLREACKVDDAEIAASGREGVRRRLSDVVPACPDELARAIWGVLDGVPALLMGRAPRNTGIVVGRDEVGRIVVHPLVAVRPYEDAVRRHLVGAARLDGGDCLGHDERFAREVFREGLDGRQMVVKADDVEGVRHEQIIGLRIDMVAG